MTTLELFGFLMIAAPLLLVINLAVVVAYIIREEHR